LKWNNTYKCTSLEKEKNVEYSAKP
jgi:hypothetical protein